MPQDFAQKLAPMAGFRNILVHEYLDLDWDEVYQHLKQLEDLYRFMDHIKHWIKKKGVWDYVTLR